VVFLALTIVIFICAMGMLLGVLRPPPLLAPRTPNVPPLLVQPSDTPTSTPSITPFPSDTPTPSRTPSS
jgi:hypothetical protein